MIFGNKFKKRMTEETFCVTVAVQKIQLFEFVKFRFFEICFGLS
jgi:hypothetical protein